MSKKETKTKDSSAAERMKLMMNIPILNEKDKIEKEKYDKFVESSGKEIISLPLDELQPAPKDWNRFPNVSESKMLEMVFSILENGLFNPIIVWRRFDKYMILSGHNRVRAYNRIISENEPEIANNYMEIPAIVYDVDDIDENKAKEIIIDTNYIQREEDKSIMPIIIRDRLKLVRGRKDNKGRTIDIVAEELGLSKTKVYEDQVIANNIIPELAEYYYDGRLNKKALLRFNWFNKGVQKSIFDKYADNINDANCYKMKKTMNIEELRDCFETIDDEKIVNVMFRVPEQYREEFREMALKWIEDRAD